MSEVKVPSEVVNTPEPLLPVEKKLIGWSLGLGIVLLVILVLVNYFVPIKV